MLTKLKFADMVDAICCFYVDGSRVEDMKFCDAKALSILLVLFLICTGCPGKSAVKGRDVAANDLDEILLEGSTDEDFHIVYEDILLGAPTVVQQKKYWQDYRVFASKLKKSSLHSLISPVSVEGGPSTEDPKEEKSLVSSILGNKKWVLVTPALWENSFASMWDDFSQNRDDIPLFSQLGEMYIQHTVGGEDAPNGKASLGKFFLDLKPQDVYLNILVTPKSGYITEFRGKNTLSTPWSDVPVEEDGITDILSSNEKFEKHSVYLVLSFPLHRKKPTEILQGEDLFFVMQFQAGIRKYIWDGHRFQFPFGGSLDSFFSAHLSRNFTKHSQNSYMGRAMDSTGLMMLMTQYKSITQHVFSQMLGESSFDVISSNDGQTENKNLICPSGYLTYAVVDQSNSSYYATYNSMVMVPFLIDKVLEDNVTGKKGLLLKGNPLAMRILPIHSVPLEGISDCAMSVSDKDATSSRETDPKAMSLEADDMKELLKSVPSFHQQTDQVEFKKSLKQLGKVAEKIGTHNDVIKGVFSALGNVRRNKRDLSVVEVNSQPSNVEEDASEKMATVPEGMKNQLLDFSWSNWKKSWEEKQFRQRAFRAKKQYEELGISSDSVVNALEVGSGITAYSNVKNHNVGAILQYAGIDLIFWPEDGLDSVLTRLRTDFQK